MEPHRIGGVAQSFSAVGLYQQLVFGVGGETVDGDAVAKGVMRGEGADVRSAGADQHQTAVGLGDAVPCGRDAVVSGVRYADVLRGGAGVRHLEDDIVDDETVADRGGEAVGQLRGEEGDVFAVAGIVVVRADAQASEPHGLRMYGVDDLVADIDGVDGDECL